MGFDRRCLWISVQILKTGPSAYGDNCAEFYDEIYGPANPVVVRTLCGLARGGACLELGLGTGRTALALVENGLTVTGIESSKRMLERFYRKTAAEKVRLIFDDFATVKLDQRFKLIFALVNTFFLIDSLPRQLQCLKNVAEMLEEDGLFVIETFAVAQEAEAFTSEGVLATLHHEVITRAGVRPYGVRLLSHLPQALDKMAFEADLTLMERWRDWGRKPHRSDDVSCISIYARANVEEKRSSTDSTEHADFFEQRYKVDGADKESM